MMKYLSYSILLFQSLEIATGFSSPNNPMFNSLNNYLGSLSDSQSNTPKDDNEMFTQTDTTMSSSSYNSNSPQQQQQQQQREIIQTSPSMNASDDLTTTASITPDDHYAKNNPGAGWAGYKNPQFGGYLDNLNQNNFEEGKQADYGDDIRWGAQVYLDNLGEESYYDDGDEIRRTGIFE